MMAVAPSPSATPVDRWQPRIVALVCNWCTYSGADMAGTARRTHAPSVRVVRLLCSGRTDPVFLLKAFEDGADAVIVSGCHPGDCHYVQGNYFARRRLTVFADLMDLLGLDRRRLTFAWVAASEGVKWSQLVDDVDATVRELGPLDAWRRGEVPSLGERPTTAEPRPPADPARLEAIQGHLRATAAALLAEGRVAAVVGYGEGALPEQTVPLVARTGDETAALVWNERCTANLAVHLGETLRRRDDGAGPVAVVAKSCDARAVAGLVRENQLDRDQVAVLSVACDGIRHDGRLAARCHACTEATSPLADWTVTADGATEGAVPLHHAAAADPRTAEIERLRALPAERRWDWWQAEFDRCLRCYACRAVCPLCYCEECVVAKHRPQWVPVAHGGAGNTAWNVVRALHLAGRCVDCDECARACPADIRLDLLNRAVAATVEERFGYRTGADPTVTAPMTTFRPDDTDGFR